MQIVAQCNDCTDSCSPSKHQWTWSRFKLSVFGIGPGALGRPASRLIHPNSLFATAFTVFVTLLLLYTALVVPVTVGFFWNYDMCYRMPTVEIDVFVDASFILQIFLSFVTGVTLKGVYYDDFSFVASQYLRGPFWFDLITSIPVSWIDMIVIAQSCSGSGASGEMVDISGLKFIRVLKPLRVFKMLRVIKVIKVLHVFDFIERVVRPPPLLFRVFRVLFGIAFLVHACACVYWLVKEVSSTPEDVADFMEENGIGADAPLVRKYVLASYFVNTVFTTVGFGDIHATNTAEQVFCVVIMYMGTIVFGVLLSEIESAVSSMRHLPRKRGRVTQSMMNFMNNHDIPAHIQKQILSWVDFDQNVKYGDALSHQCLDMLPPELRKIVVGQLHHDQLFRIPIFSAISHNHRERLIIDLWDAMKTTTHPQSLPLVWADDVADRLHFIMEGSVRVTLRDGSFISDLGPGDFFGELALLGDELTGAEFGMKANYVCSTNVVVRSLSRQDFLDVVSRFPEALVEELAMLRQEQVKRITQQEECKEDEEEEKELVTELTQHAKGAGVGNWGTCAVVSDRVAARWAFVVRKALWNKRSEALGTTDLWQRAAHKITLQNPLAWAMSSVDEDDGGEEAGAGAAVCNLAADKLEKWLNSHTRSAQRMESMMGSLPAQRLTVDTSEAAGAARRRKSSIRVISSHARRRSSTMAAEAIVRSGLNSPIRRMSSGSQCSRKGSVSSEEQSPGPKLRKEREDTAAMKKRLLALAPSGGAPSVEQSSLAIGANSNGPSCNNSGIVSRKGSASASGGGGGQGVEQKVEGLQGLIALQSEMIRAQSEALVRMQQQMDLLTRHVLRAEPAPAADALELGARAAPDAGSAQRGAGDGVRWDWEPSLGRVRVLSLSGERASGDREAMVLDRSDSEEEPEVRPALSLSLSTQITDRPGS